jgi:Mu-like prophage FluMu protein gp41
MENNTELTPEAQALENSIISDLQNGTFSLIKGLAYGVGAEKEMQYVVSFRELTAGDLIDAQVASEKVVMTKEGPVLVSSPALMGVEMLRRQIAKVGCINGPLSLTQLKALDPEDFQRLSIATDVRDIALAASMSNDRGRVVAVSE